MKNLINTKNLYISTFNDIKSKLNSNIITEEKAVAQLNIIKTNLKTIISNIKAMYSEQDINLLLDIVFDIEEYIESLNVYEVENFDGMNEFAINRFGGIIEDESVESVDI